MLRRLRGSGFEEWRNYPKPSLFAENTGEGEMSWQRIRSSSLQAFPNLKSKFRAQTSLQLPNPVPKRVHWSRCQVADLLKEQGVASTDLLAAA
jgi:hypothetical protein